MTRSRSRALLVAVSNELAEIRERLEDLADLTSGLMAEASPEHQAGVVTDIQDFDLLIQRLDGLSGLAAALGAGTPLATALHALTLSDLYDRLAGDTGLRPAASARPGELTLFD